MRVFRTLALAALVLAALLDIYIYRRLRRGLQRWLHLGLSAFMVAVLVLIMWHPTSWPLQTVMWLIYAFFSVYLSKLVFVIVDALGLLPRLFGHRRLRAFTWAGCILGAVTYGTLWWAALINRFNIQVTRVEIYSPDLPAAFDGFTIAQLSDLHVGTLGSDTTFISRLVQRTDSLHPDMIVFTGDIVNSSTDELLPFISPLSRLKAPCGVWSVLGNHDYGDYRAWPSPQAKQQNLQLLRTLQRRMGWRLLDNGHARIVRDADTIVLAGVENVGDPPFTTYGSLAKAYPDAADSRYKILLSHNPAHWADSIYGNPRTNIQLTLSGHTHAMQTEVLGLSPAALRYPYWGGLYSDGHNRQLYVNIGAGTVGFPARIGARPEITLLTLRRGSSPKSR